jgi:hypothetical protein
MEQQIESLPGLQRSERAGGIRDSRREERGGRGGSGG